MVYKNTWTRIAARWEENKSFKDLLMQAYHDDDGPYMSDLQDVVDKIIGIDYVLTTFTSDSGFGDGLSKRLQKFSDAYIDTSNNTLGSYLSDLLNTDYESSVADGYWLANKQQTVQEYINKNKFLLDNASNYVNKVYNIIDSIQVNDDIEKAQKQKVLQTIKIKGDKLVKSCNDFKMLLKTELNENSNLSNFKPFYLLYNEYGEILDKNKNFDLDISDMHNDFYNKVYKFETKIDAQSFVDDYIDAYWDKKFNGGEYEEIYNKYVEEHGESPDTSQDLGLDPVNIYCVYIQNINELKNLDRIFDEQHENLGGY